MKLLLCTKCQSIFSLVRSKVRSCECNNVKGIYIDELNARFTAETEDYFMLGFANYTVSKAISDYRRYGSPDGMGLNFTAFVIPEPCDTFIRVGADEFGEIEANL